MAQIWKVKATPLLIALLFGGASCATKPDATARGNAEEAILAQERGALDRWSQGDRQGYAEIAAEDVTYFDDITASTRIDGLEAFRSYITSLEGKVPPHRYELVNPKVQVYGDVGILTLRYHVFAPDGTPRTQWKATSVYRWNAGEWRIVHANWSTVKGP